MANFDSYRTRLFFGVESEQALRIWEKFVENYFGDIDEDKKEKIIKIASCISAFRYFCLSFMGPMKDDELNETKKGMLNQMRTHFFDIVDEGIELLGSVNELYDWKK